MHLIHVHIMTVQYIDENDIFCKLEYNTCEEIFI